MMFDANNGAAARKWKLLLILSYCFMLSVWGGVAYVAIHFIHKYW